jgi:fucose 4-O-acetylase-like acetyltransferase
MRPRLPVLDQAKGIAITLVVFGHLAEPRELADAWYGVAKAGVYLFHMPLFFALSGVGAGLALEGPPPWPRVWRTAAKRIRLLAHGYVLLGLCALLWTQLAGGSVAGATERLARLAWDPIGGPLQQLWFLYVLAIYQVTLVPLARAAGRHLPFYIALSLALQGLPLPRVFCLSMAGRHAIFFLVGIWIGLRWRASGSPVRRPLAVAAGVSLLVAGMAWRIHDGPLEACRTLAGLGSIAVALAIAPITGGLGAMLGRRSYAIFLIHPLILGVLRPSLERAGAWGSGPAFVLAAAASTAIAVLVPVVLKERILRRSKYLDYATG